MTEERIPVFTRHPISKTWQYGVVLKSGDKLEATDVYDSTTGQWSACSCPGLTAQEGCATIWVGPHPPIVMVYAGSPDPDEPSAPRPSNSGRTGW